MAERHRDEHGTRYAAICKQLTEDAERLDYLEGDVGFERLLQSFAKLDKQYSKHDRYRRTSTIEPGGQRPSLATLANVDDLVATPNLLTRTAVLLVMLVVGGRTGRGGS